MRSSNNHRISHLVRTLHVVSLISMATMDCDAQSFKNASTVLSAHVRTESEWALQQTPVTVTSFSCERSAGGKHDFYSEGDYWWPDPENPGGPYIQRDGMTNPDNFVAHRRAMIRFSKIIGALASMYTLTGDDKYVSQAFVHLKAWFADSTTRMNPSLLYAQAISGRATGRGIGIIDTIHLIEVAQGIKVMERSPQANGKILAEVKQWFNLYLQWLFTHPYSVQEMNATNNHGTCWVMQVASFAKLTENDSILQFCRSRYKEVLLPNQMSPDGSFHRELGRTKPYGYSLFNLDAMVMICLILSDDHDNLWEFRTNDGKCIRKGIEFLFPYITEKTSWPYPHDVMYWDNWPVAQPFLIMGANHFNVKEWFDAWRSLDHDPDVEEVIRNLPVRNPLIWINN